jgi:hypothetical protein
VHGFVTAPRTTRNDLPASGAEGRRFESYWAHQILSTTLSFVERRLFEWPLAKDHRAHVHQIIERHELPVAHPTRRTGRPYTLVLTRREALFEREAARPKQLLKDLEWPKRALS